ncbi:MAG: hypothetical protein EPN31_12985 [Castellaniella sp.]|uniref:TcpQ domain-containing protein n=1 Tax=Castellaniella sp. TaxID=1955812 RepID=UPI0011F46463|nr:TcpQ domain-containing protein [Castellaniella sp.]TAN26595.1 MAG: hypothetical protein EPN31_12985 [Castellaniella sp.]
MFRLLGAGVLVLTLAGCATSSGPQWWRTLAGLSPVPGHFRFDWHMDGDPSLAPLQVFDDGRRTWLQYPVGQPAPAVFERTAGGDRLLHPGREGDYLVITGVPTRLLVRGGQLQAQIWREPGVDSAAPIPASAEHAPVTLSPVSPAAVSAAPAQAFVPVPIAAVASPPPTAQAPALLPSPPPPPPSLPLPPPPVSLAPDVSVPGQADISSVRRSSSQGSPATGRPRSRGFFEATPADGNIRRVLGRWARSAGWLFESEHWAVDVDIPLAGSAAFGEEFVPAVRSLLAATELGDRPLQPCFYANQVLRVVPLAQRCDRTQVPGASS